MRDRRSIVSFTLFHALIIVLGLNEDAAAWKPTMYPVGGRFGDGEVIVQAGDELRLVCEGGGRRVNFTTQKLTTYVDPREFTILHDEGSGAFTFIRPEATRTDTGWYACAEEDVAVQNTEQVVNHSDENISWIYVYVNSSEPFAVMEALYDFISAVAEGDAVIPCRPTSPDLDVVLYHESKPGEFPEQPFFDPKIGFLLKELNIYQSGENYRCEIRELGESVVNDWPVYALHVSNSAPLESPYINKDDLNHVVSGQNLTLYCSIRIPANEKFDMKWLPPTTLPPERFTNVKLRPISKTSKKENWATELRVFDVRKEDAGVYVCEAQKPGCSSIKSSVKITVWDPSYKYINMSVKGDEHVFVKAKDTVQWVVIIDTYPEQFELTWYNENGNEIKTNETDPISRYIHNRHNKTHHMFIILGAAVEDTGNYTILVRTPENESSIVLQLNVTDVPIVHLQPTKAYYSPGETASFSSFVIGSPLPNVIWNYMEYPDFPSKENRKLIPVSDFANTRNERYRFKLQSFSNVTINMTGDLICKACNDVDCTEVTQPIFVSDVNGFFGIKAPEIVTEGDDISIVCGASVYNFTDNITWTSNDTAKLAEFESDRISVVNKTTAFTSQSILEIRNVKKSDAGDFFCEVENKEGNTETEFYRLLVEDQRLPVIESNMNNSEVSIVSKTEKDKGITMECRADGRPVPELTWHKNNELLTRSKQFKFSKNNTRLEIAYFLDGDSGKYYCEASSRIGRAQKYMDIQITGKSQSQNIITWIIGFGVLIGISLVAITYMGVKVHRERVLRTELLKAGLTHFEGGALECLNPDLTVDDQAELLPYDKKWEFPRELLKLGKQLGSGAFGVVMKAEARGICVEGEVTTVAVKMVRRSADPSYMKALSSELKIMIHLGRHLNVVNLLGACTKTILTKRELYVIVEYCRFGNLHNYLQRHRASFINQIDPSTQKIDPNIGIERLVRSESIESQNRLKYAALSFSRSVSVKSSDSNSGSDLVDYRQGTDFADINMSPDGGVLSNNSVQPGWRSNYRGDYKDQNLKPICTQDLLCWAWQVARGMEYLSARKVLHGDLAARNILLADDNIVKICDFGLAKNMYKDNNYTKKGEGPLPIKWMAIESIRDRMFSTQSDVWSYGIVLWEFFTLARTPYPGMEAEKQYDKLIEGYRMEKPEYATDEIYDFMLHCWKAKPSLRPTFPELAERIGTLLNESIKMHYVDLNTPYIDMNTAAFENGKNDYLAMMSSPNHDYHNAPEPMLQARRPDSAYLSMSPLNKSMEPGIFSPRSELEESHFSFPSPSANSPITSDTEDCVEAVPMLINDDPYLKPIDVKQRRAEFVKQSKAEAPIERDSGYCNVSSNPHFAKANDQSSDPINNLDKNSNPNEQNENNVKYTSPIIHGQDNYVNMPQQKNNRAKDAVLDSFSNPSYVIMSKLEDDRQFV